MSDGRRSDPRLTIVLTLKDRSAFTYRWLRYMDDARCPYHILIADGGQDAEVERLCRASERYPHLDYEYIRYPFDATTRDYLTKFENVVSRVQSDYLLLADNDDFYLLDAFPDLLGFLDGHPDHVGARGELVDFTLFDRDGQPLAASTGVRYEALAHGARSIDAASPLDRVDALCRDMSRYDYYVNWYCVFRADAFKDIWRSLVTLDTDEIIVTEILTHVLLAMRGKIAILPRPYYARQQHTSSSGGTLVIGNQFLERCLINDSLSQFGVAVDRFAGVGAEERDRLLRAIAAWLEVFVSNIYLTRQAAGGRLARFRTGVKRLPVVRTLATRVYYHAASALSGSRPRRVMRLPAIEPYVTVEPTAGAG